jgi:hypothetical protein
MSLKEALDILGVSLPFSEEEVKHRYRFLAMAFHPDRFPESSPLRKEAEETFKRLEEAKKILLEYLKEGVKYSSSSSQKNAYSKQSTPPPQDSATGDAKKASTGYAPKENLSQKPSYTAPVIILCLSLIVLAFWFFSARYNAKNAISIKSDTAKHIAPAPSQEASSPSSYVPISLLDTAYNIDLGYKDNWHSVVVDDKVLTSALSNDDFWLVTKGSNGFENRYLMPAYVEVGSDAIWRVDGIKYFVRIGNYPHFGVESGCFIVNLYTNKASRVHILDAKYVDTIYLDGVLQPKTSNEIYQLLGEPLPENVLRKLSDNLSLHKPVKVTGELCTEYYCDGESGPHYRAIFNRPIDTALFARYGLYVGIPYASARKRLLNQGWQPFINESDKGSEEMPEAHVGNATGDAVLIRGTLKLLFTLEPDYTVQAIEEQF